MPAEGLAAEGMDERDCQLAEKAIFLKAEPGRTRFARFETKTVQRQKFGDAPVFEVRSPWLDAFGTKRKSPETGASPGFARQ
jgi:hypothetical protein